MLLFVTCYFLFWDNQNLEESVITIIQPSLLDHDVLILTLCIFMSILTTSFGAILSSRKALWLCITLSVSIAVFGIVYSTCDHKYDPMCYGT